MNNLIELANFIDSKMNYWISLNPNNKNQIDCETYIIDSIMKYTNNQIGIVLALQLIRLHEKPMKDAGLVFTISSKLFTE
jgi:hypothetical protein